MTLVEVFPRWSWITDLRAREKKAAIREMLNHLVIEGRIKEDAARKVEKIVHKREAQGSTAIGKGLAIPHAKGCTFIKDVLEAGQVTPVIDRTYPLAEAAEAIRYLEQGHAQGKVVLTI